ncbi:hypothetical protein AV530_007704 [Patagioenas fasciata monilis]|uniref:Uncharacterized protein n=1 Tax=Patagioenas fasciata monilis TaxID=372326 RepID=A0A1V4JYS9_PATFA|nr:hypothetical protein AV530_007704 [Patagioenas fasciata monilis]
MGAEGERERAREILPPSSCTSMRDTIDLHLCLGPTTSDAGKHSLDWQHPALRLVIALQHLAKVTQVLGTSEMQRSHDVQLLQQSVELLITLRAVTGLLRASSQRRAEVHMEMLSVRRCSYLCLWRTEIKHIHGKRGWLASPPGSDVLTDDQISSQPRVVTSLAGEQGGGWWVLLWLPGNSTGEQSPANPRCAQSFISCD